MFNRFFYFIIFSFLISGISIFAYNGEIPLIDFSKENYNITTGIKDISGQVSKAKTSDNKDAFKVEFDFTKATTNRNCYVSMLLNTVLLAKPEELHFEFENPNTTNLPMAVVFKDVSGETFFTRLTIPANQKEVNVKVHKSPAWPSGDKNGKMDFPITLESFLFDRGSIDNGEFYIKKASLTCTIDENSAIGTKLISSRYQFGKPEFKAIIDVSAYNKEIEAEYNYTLTLIDTFTNKEALKISNNFAIPLEDNQLSIEIKQQIPYGSYSANLEVKNNKTGILLSEQTTGIRVMTKSCANYGSEAERKHEYLYGTVGGCSDFTTPIDSEALGRRWFRYEHPNWRTVEVAPGEYDFTSYKEVAKTWKAQNIRLNTLQTLYHYPTFYTPTNLPEFSRGYGRYFQAMAGEMRGIIDDHELGNEDNGANKNLYTEVGRHGAAGIRSRQPFATIGNSGTAHIDYAWLEMQIKKGLFDTVDAIAVHPYTNNSTCSESASPEAFKTDEQLERLYNLAFLVGGMKEFWNTEFGWPNGGAEVEKHRTNMYVRMLIFGDAAGMRMQTVYNWDRDYNTVRYASGVALHQFVQKRMGTKFVGIIHDQKTNYYTAVYEGSGKAFAIQWTTNDQDLSPILKGDYYDIFGNSVKNPKISKSVNYIDNIDNSLVKTVAKAQIEKVAMRFKTKLKEYPSSKFNSFVNITPTDTTKLKQTILKTLDSFTDSISKKDQAHFAFVINWYLATSRYFPETSSPNIDHDITKFKKVVEQLNDEDLDLPSVRWLLRHYEKTSLELELAENNQIYQNSCKQELEVLYSAMNTFSKFGERIQFAVFTNLYMKTNDDYEEKLCFVPTLPTKVQFRVSSYSAKPQKVTVKPVLPQGWKGEPVTVNVPAEGETWGELTIIAPSGADARQIYISTDIAGKPSRVTTFTTIEYRPAVSVTIPLVSKNSDSISLVFSNQETKTVTGQAKILPMGVSGAPLKIADLSIKAKETQTINMPLTSEMAQRIANSEHAIDVQIFLKDGRKFEVANLDIDYGIAIKMPKNTIIDGDLSKWSGALPIRLNKEEYARGSYGNSYTTNDLSAITWLGWNEEKLYFAAKVQDQVIHQIHTGDAMWNQDSIQLLFAENRDDKIQEFTIALSPEGARIWDQTRREEVEPAEVFISYKNGEFIYEFALPWSLIGEQYTKAVERGSLLYAIAINDDDVLVPRRYLERFPDTVVNSRRVAFLPEIKLSEQTTQPIKKSDVVFYEDFNSYEKDSVPFGWEHRHSNYPRGTTQVVTEQGEKGKNALLISNDISNKPHHFCIITNEFKTEPIVQYEIRVRLKGTNIKSADIGYCSDEYGNQDFSYIKLPENVPNWTTFTIKRRGGQTGSGRIVIRTKDQVGTLLIDNIEVVKLTK